MSTYEKDGEPPWLPIFFGEKSIKTPLLLNSLDNKKSKESRSQGVASQVLACGLQNYYCHIFLS